MDTPQQGVCVARDDLGTCAGWTSRTPTREIHITLTRGARVVATGRLKQRTYTKDDEKRTVIELEVKEIGPSLRYATFRRVFTKSEVLSDGNPSIEAA
jgi:single-stranded DNA-binding protein